MSTTDHSAQDGSPAGDDLLAAEYVLGTLPLADRAAFEARLKRDSALTMPVAGWEAHFAPLNDFYAEATAPNLLPKIEARLFAVQTRHRLPIWSGLLGGLVAAGLVLLAVQQFRQGPPLIAPDLGATLAAQGQPLIFMVSYDIETAALTVTQTSGAPPAEGNDYELWVIGTSGTPVSLGIIPGPSATMTVKDIQPDFVLAISLEAKGGSTTGAPAQVLVTGQVTSL